VERERFDMDDVTKTFFKEQSYAPLRRIFLHESAPHVVHLVMRRLCVWGGPDAERGLYIGYEFAPDRFDVAEKYLAEKGYVAIDEPTESV
jgi:hypothetical protein